MTIVDSIETSIEPIAAAPLRPVGMDLYRDIHKGIRRELFSLTERAGSLDPGSREDRGDFAAWMSRTVELLVSHADHEDTHVQPAVERHLPDLAARIETDHHQLEAKIALLDEQAREHVGAAGDLRWAIHGLYVDLAAFTSAYLHHQDLEERVVMPQLEAAIGVEATLDIHEAIVGTMPPEEMATGLAVMLPAMNVDDRVELLGGIRAGAPEEVFSGVWSLTGSVLSEGAVEQLAVRLGW